MEGRLTLTHTQQQEDDGTQPLGEAEEEHDDVAWAKELLQEAVQAQGASIQEDQVEEAAATDAWVRVVPGRVPARCNSWCMSLGLLVCWSCGGVLGHCCINW